VSRQLRALLDGKWS